MDGDRTVSTMSYDEETKSRNATTLDQSASRGNVMAAPTSLMLIKGGYDSKIEKLDIYEKNKRKILTEREPGYELQALYHINAS